MSGRTGRLIGRLVVAGVASAGTRVALARARSMPWAASLDRTNHRGRPVSLTAGPVVVVAASLSASLGAAAHGRGRLAAACLAAGLGSGAVGLYDDVMGARPEHKSTKGFRGHLGALREGRVTSGLVKIIGVTGVGLAASALLPGATRQRLPRLRRATDVVLGAGVIAGMANLVNLFDLRPGRALKTALLIGIPLAATAADTDTTAGAGKKASASTKAGAGTTAGGGRATGSEVLKARLAAGAAAAAVVGTAAATLPDDLNEQVMIGDSGANAIGALLGLALVARSGTLGRAVLLSGLVGLTAASEKVSFTKVIDSTPGLRELDRLGRKR